MISLARKMLLNQGFNRPPVEKTLYGRIGAQKALFDELLQGSSKPLLQGQTETHFPSLQICPYAGESIADCQPEKAFSHGARVMTLQRGALTLLVWKQELAFTTWNQRASVFICGPLPAFRKRQTL